MGGPLAKEDSSDKYEHTSKLLLNNFWCNCLQEIHSHWGVHLPSFVYQYPRHLSSINWGGPLAKVGLSAKFGVAVFKASILDSLGRPIGQSRFVCQVWCTSIQGIYPLFMGGPSAKVGLSAKFGVAVFKASILDSLGGPSAKVGSSAKFGVPVFKASILNSLGGVHGPKEVSLPSLV